MASLGRAGVVRSSLGSENIRPQPPRFTRAAREAYKLQSAPPLSIRGSSIRHSPVTIGAPERSSFPGSWALDHFPEEPQVKPSYLPQDTYWTVVDDLLDSSFINDATLVPHLAAVERVVSMERMLCASDQVVSPMGRSDALRSFLNGCLDRAIGLQSAGVTPLVLLLRVVSWLRLGEGERGAFFLDYARRLALALHGALGFFGGTLRPQETLAALEAWARWDGLGAAFRRGRPEFAGSLQGALRNASFTPGESVRVLAAIASVRTAQCPTWAPCATVVEQLGSSVARAVSSLTDEELVLGLGAPRGLSWPYYQCIVPVVQELFVEAASRHGTKEAHASAKKQSRSAGTAVAVGLAAAEAFHRPTAAKLRQLLAGAGS